MSNMTVQAKLMKARLMLQGKELKKSGHNKFAGYNYFELGDFLPVVQEIFAGLGLCGIADLDPRYRGSRLDRRALYDVRSHGRECARGGSRRRGALGRDQRITAERLADGLEVIHRDV